MLFEGMAEWLNAAVLKAAKGTNLRGSESLSLRQFMPSVSVSRAHFRLEESVQIRHARLYNSLRDSAESAKGNNMRRRAGRLKMPAQILWLASACYEGTGRTK